MRQSRLPGGFVGGKIDGRKFGAGDGPVAAFKKPHLQVNRRPRARNETEHVAKEEPKSQALAGIQRHGTTLGPYTRFAKHHTPG